MKAYLLIAITGVLQTIGITEVDSIISPLIYILLPCESRIDFVHLKQYGLRVCRLP